MDICYFQLQDWAHRDIVMVHIPGTLNPSDDATKPLGSILHCRHCWRIMGHYNTKNMVEISATNLGVCYFSVMHIHYKN